MGTRSLTRVYNENSQALFNLYRQYDGYPSGHGSQLFEFLKGKVANGAGCLAAQLIAYFKTGTGGFYLEPIGARDCGQEYEYEIHVNVADVYCKVIECGSRRKTLFEGDVADFGEFCSKED